MFVYGEIFCCFLKGIGGGIIIEAFISHVVFLAIIDTHTRKRGYMQLFPPLVIVNREGEEGKGEVFGGGRRFFVKRARSSIEVKCNVLSESQSGDRFGLGDERIFVVPPPKRLMDG